MVTVLKVQTEDLEVWKKMYFKKLVRLQIFLYS